MAKCELDGVCKEEFVRRMARYLDLVGSCKENVRRNARYLI